MAEPLPRPQVPFTKEFSPYQSQDKPVISSEDIRAKLHDVNNFFDANLPAAIKGMNQYEQDLLDEKIMSKKPASFGQTKQLPEVQNELIGNVLTGSRQSKNLSDLPTFDKISSYVSKTSLQNQIGVDPYKFARPTSFNASIYGHNFDRYYSHPKFKTLGFDIRRDNESLYNASATSFDDFRRMSSKLVSNIALAGTDSFKNWGDWFSFTGDPNSAALMEHNMASGASSKEGAGAWVTNFVGNLGYTLGTIGELWVENAAVAAAAGLTRSPSLMALAGAKTGLGLGKLAKSMKVMTKTLNDVNKARQFRTAAMNIPKGIFQAANPFRELTNVAGQALNPNSAFNRLNGMAKASKSFGAFYRGLREINAVTAESRLEAAFVQNKVANEAVNAYYKKNGKMPEGVDADAITKRAREAGEKTFLANVPVIYASNQLVLGTSLRGFVPKSRLISASNLKGTFFKTVRNFDWKKTGAAPMEVVARQGVIPGTFKFMGSLVKKDFWKNVPSRLKGTYASKPFSRALGSGIRYLSANLAEGLQETYQEAAQTATSDYYLTNYFADLYKDPILAAQNSWAASIQKGVSSQMSSQGFDTFLQGFLTGGVVGPMQTNIVKWFESVNLRMKDYRNPGSREKYIEDEKKRLQQYADAVNSYTQDPVLWSRWISENAIHQRDFQERINLAEEIGDREAAETAKDDALFIHVDTLLRADKFDEFIDHLKGLTDLTDDELKEAFENYDVEEIDQNEKSPRERLQISIDKAKEIKGRIERLNKVENPFNPDLFDPATDTEAYLAEYMGYNSFEIAKRAVAFNEYTYKRTADRIESLLNKSVTSGPLGSTLASEFTLLFSPIGMTPETSNSRWYQYEQLLQAEIKALNVGTPEEKQLAAYKKRQLESLRTLKSFIVDYRKNRILINKAKAAAQDYASAPKESQEAYDALKKLASVLDKESKNGQLELDFENPDLPVDVIVDTFTKNLLYDAYNDYVDVIAKTNDAGKVKETVDKSFNEFLDYLQLSSDHHLMGEFMTTLSDPMALYRMSSRIYEAQKLISERSGELHKQGLEEYISKIAAPDALMQNLFDIGVYFDPDFIEEFLEKDMIPPYFINATDGSIIEESDPKYNEIVDLIQNYAIQTGKKYYNMPEKYVAPVPEEQKAPPVSNVPPEEEDEEATGKKEASVSDALSSLAPELRLAIINAAKAKNMDPEDFMLNDPEAITIIENYNKAKSAAVDISTVTGSITTANPKSITPEMMPGVERILEASAAEEWETDETDTRYYVNKDRTKRVRRATSLLNKEFTKSARLTAQQNRGNALDVLLRDFFNPETKDGAITKLAFRDVIINMLEGKRNGVYTEAAIKSTIKKWLKENLSEEDLYARYKFKTTDGFYNSLTDVLYDIAGKLKDYKIVSSMPTMFGMGSTGELVGGTLDLLAEHENGTLHIFDIKTFNTDRLSEETRNSDRVQQNTYREIIEGNSDRKISTQNTIEIEVGLQTDNETLVKAKLRKNAKGGILNNVPKGEVKAILEEIETGVKPEPTPGQGGPEQKETKLYVRPRFKGKLVYMTPGSGKTVATQRAKKAGLQVADMDDLLVEAIKAAGVDVKALGVNEVNNSNVGKVLYEMYRNNMSDKADSIYGAVVAKTEELLKSGYTVLTGSQRFMKRADIVVTNKDRGSLAAQLLAKTGQTDNRSKMTSITAEEESIFTRSPEKVEVLSEQKASDLLLSEVETEEEKPFSETADVTKMREAKSKMELSATVMSYATNKNLYTYVAKDGSRRKYTPTEIAIIAKERAVALNLDSEFLDYIDDVLDLRKGPISKAEENDLKENIEAATEDTIDSNTVSGIASDMAKNDTDITDDDIDNLNNCETPGT